jgi:hypothetical protein
VALIDDLAARLGPVQEAAAEEVGFYDVEELDDLGAHGVQDVQVGGMSRMATGSNAVITPVDARERLLQGRIERPTSYAHVLVDEAQDLSPMQWRMLGRRGRSASWTVVGDAAQASWGDLARRSRRGERHTAHCRSSPSTWTPTIATRARSSTTRGA